MKNYRFAISSLLIIIFTLSILTYSNEKMDADEIKDTWIDSSYVEYIEEVSAEYSISPELITAIVERESSGQRYAYEPIGDTYGLMQLAPTWHKERMKRLGVTDLYEPYGNIRVGVDFISYLFREYNGNIYKVLMFYNEGYQGSIKASNHQYSDYATSILNRAWELEEVHGKHDYTDVDGRDIRIEDFEDYEEMSGGVG